MKADQIERPNSTCDYWDVPDSNRIIKQSKVIGRGGPWVFEVLEPTNVMGPHGTIMFLRHKNDNAECYGTVQSHRCPHTTEILSKISDLKFRGECFAELQRLQDMECYGTIADVLGWDWLLDLGRVKIDWGRIEVYPDLAEPTKESREFEEMFR